MEEITLMPKPAHQFPPHAKYIISSPTGEFPDLDVSFDVASWDELDVNLERDATTGTYTDVSFPIRIALKGRELLKFLFEKDQLYAKAVFSIYTRSWNPPFVYTLIKRMDLDFLTYSDDGNYVEISGVQAELIEYLNSCGKNKYDIPVADIVENTRWEYQRMEMLNQGTWIPVPGNTAYNGNRGDALQVRLPVYLNQSQTEMTPGSAEHDMKDQKAGKGFDDYFFMAADDVDIRVSMKFKVFKQDFDSFGGRVDTIAIYKTKGSTRTIAWQNTSPGGSTATIDEVVSISLQRGDTLTLAASGYMFMDGNARVGFLDVDSKFTVSYYANAPALTDESAIHVIDPQTLMQKYLDLMAPGRFTCEIEWKDEPHPIKLVAGESLRNYPLTGNEDQIAYLHGSPNDFQKFMRVLGYEFEVDGDIMRYKRRDEYFLRDVTAKRFNKSEISEFKIVANEEFAFTKIVIGCEKQDYESINGRFESNFTHEYLTGFKNVDPLELNLVSPYRTDPIGIELTTWERKNKYTDKKADSDIFAVVLNRDGNRYIEVTDIYMEENATSIDRIKMFNATLNPYYLMKRNESLIGIISRKAIFTGSEGSKSTAIVDGVNRIDPRTDMTVTRKLFDPIVYNFDVGFKLGLPDVSTRNGLVYVPFKGQIYKGFIYNARKNPGHEFPATWTLWALME